MYRDSPLLSDDTDGNCHPDGGYWLYNYNVTGLYAMDNAGAESAKYEYAPFGEPLQATGPLADDNPYRFSTKYHDEETEFLYYGYRYYNPDTGRWINRDPKEEQGGHNLFAFSHNDLITHVDPLGFDRWFVNYDEAYLPHAYLIIDDCQSGRKLRIELAPISKNALEDAIEKGIKSPTSSELATSSASAVCLLASRGLIAIGYVSMTYVDEVPDRAKRIKSSQKADQELIRKAKEGRLKPPIYSFWFYNCRHWALDHVNIGVFEESKIRTSGNIPIFPFAVPNDGKRGGASDPRFNPFIIFGFLWDF